jgi:hypothetical protein
MKYFYFKQYILSPFFKNRHLKFNKKKYFFIFTLETTLEFDLFFKFYHKDS